MPNYKEQLRKNVWQRYREEVSSDPVDLKTVAAWAIERGLWKPRPMDLSASLANDLAQALREEKRTDKAGREYRANIPVRQKAKTGETLFEWADIDEAPRLHVEKSVQQERRSIASDCYALVMKVDHYNEAHPTEEPIQIVMDFEEDIEEMKIANGLLGEDDEAA
ncbi:MAG: hypothetical protein QNJ09_12540 [Paracoccaceae bacterium]|nr:hypothetical protein [Paracoccaceae bacterium]